MLVTAYFDPDTEPASSLPHVLALCGDATQLDLVLTDPRGGPQAEEVDLDEHHPMSDALRSALDARLGEQGWTVEPLSEEPHHPAPEDPPEPMHVRALRVGPKRSAEAALAAAEESGASRIVVVQRELIGKGRPSTQRRRVFLEQARSEVVVVRPGPNPGDDVVLGVARGPQARAAMVVGHAIAARAGGTTIAAYVEPPVGEDAGGVGRRTLDKMLTRALGSDHGEVRRQVVIHDVAADGLADLVEEHPTAWVVLGTSRKTRLGRFLRSTTALRLANQRPEATLVVVRAATPLAGRLIRRIEASVLRHVPQLEREARLDLVERVQSNSHWDFDFKALMCLATLIATFGLVADAPAVIIGAMLVAPLMTPLLGMGLALVQGNAKLARMTLRSVVSGFVMAFVIGAGVGVLHGIDAATDEMHMRNWPGMVDLGVAFVSGLAAAYASSRPNLSAALPGVAIAAALVPPIATSGLAMAIGDLSLCAGAALLFGTNLVTIVLASALTLWSVGLRTGQDGSPTTRRLGIALGAAAFGLAGWLTLAPPSYHAPFVPDEDVQEIVADHLGDDFELVECRYLRLDAPRQLRVVVRGAHPPPVALAESIRDALDERVGAGLEVHLEGVLVVAATASPPGADRTP